MTTPAAVRTGKLSIPRNPLIPEASAADVMISGSMLKSASGKTEGYPMPLFVGDGPTGTKFTMQRPGYLYYFRRGRIYVPDEAKTAAAVLFEGAASTAQMLLPAAAEMTGWLSMFVEKGGDFLIDRALEGSKKEAPHGPSTLGDQVKVLEKRGMVFLPGVNLVEIDYQLEPAGFLSKEVHRVVYSYQGTDGKIVRYQTGAAMKGAKSQPAIQLMEIVLRERMWDELHTLAELAQRDLGEGASPQAYGIRVLEMIQPMAATYDKTPILDGMMNDLRELARGIIPTA